jgi:hypothetical protein
VLDEDEVSLPISRFTAFIPGTFLLNLTPSARDRIAQKNDGILIGFDPF